MNEENLWAFFEKNVKIIDIDNQTFMGYVDEFTPSVDNDCGEASICIRNQENKQLIVFRLSEIKSIETI